MNLKERLYELVELKKRYDEALVDTEIDRNTFAMLSEQWEKNKSYHGSELLLLALAGLQLAEAVKQMDCSDAPNVGKHQEWENKSWGMMTDVENKIRSNRELAVFNNNHEWRFQRDAALAAFDSSTKTD